LFEKGVFYKFHIKDRIFYTGKVIEEDEFFVKIFTIKEESIILSKKDIVQSWRRDNLD